MLNRQSVFQPLAPFLFNSLRDWELEGKPQWVSLILKSFFKIHINCAVQNIFPSERIATCLSDFFGNPENISLASFHLTNIFSDGKMFLTAFLGG